jgi:hypothetical protein
MVVAMASACTDSDDESANSSSSAAAAKRTAAPEGSPALKTRRKLPETFPDIIGSGELLEPSGALEQQLRFVSGNACLNESSSEDRVLPLPGLVGQMQTLGISQSGNSEKSAEQDMWRLCVQPGFLKNIHTTEEDGWQIVDAYGEKTPPQHSPSPSPERVADASSNVLAPSQGNPIVTRRDTPGHFRWLVENIPFPASTYNIRIDGVKQQIVIKTNNRKYYKRIDVPELVDLGVQLNDKLLTWMHCKDTLTVTYAKPAGS